MALAGFCQLALAQSESVKVNYQKIEREAIANEIPFSEKTIMGTIEDKMAVLGYKGKEAKGFIAYQSVRLAELGTGEYDLYFMAERKSRRNKDNATLTLMISKGADDFATAKKDADLWRKAKAYLDNILPAITAYDLEQQINEQQDVVDKADKKYNNLVEDGQSLEKKRKSIEKDIENNKKDQEKQQADMEKEKLRLETLKSGRKQ